VVYGFLKMVRSSLSTGLCCARTFSVWSYILVSFDEAPPAIFWTRSWPSSVLSSSSCLVRSSFDLPQSWEDLTRAVDDYIVCQLSHSSL
jgi:hypothetical protein